MGALSLMVSAALVLSLASVAVAQERRAAIPRSAVRAGGGQTGGDGGQGQAQSGGQGQGRGSAQAQGQGSARAQGQGSARAQSRPPDRAAAAPPSVRTGQGRARAGQREQDGGNPTPTWRNQGGLGSDMVFTQQNPQAVRRVDPVSRPQGGAPPVGVAVPRPAGVRPGPSPRIVYAPYGQVYSYYAYPRYIYAYPRHIYPYGYGALGLGYFYYNPYGWHP